MLSNLKKIAIKFLPLNLIFLYHACNAKIAAFFYGYPGKKLKIIGITGTKGKTSTANLVWSVLTHGGIKTGLLGTAQIIIGDQERINTLHMTMPGPWITQKILKEMLDAGCTHAIMEVTSEGLKQYRHYGIDYSFAIFTNLSPEHLASHENSFEKYKQTKARLFQSLSVVLNSVSIVNADSEHGKYYGQFTAAKNLSYGIHNGDIRANDILETNETVSFSVGIERYSLRLLGAFNIYNALPAIIVGHELNIPFEKIREGLNSLLVIPGRMEKISVGQDFTVIVDYAHEQLSINTLLDTAIKWKKEENNNIICVIGAEGGGRDKAKQEHMGRAAGIKSEYVVVTTTDPYDDDPQILADSVAHFATVAGKEKDKTLFVILDRREAIAKALSLARSGDIVLFTGMGAQETMIVKGRALPWNEREIVREELKKLNLNNI